MIHKKLIELKGYTQFALNVARSAAQLGVRAGADAIFMHAVYRYLLDREPDPAGLADYLPRLQNKALTRRAFIDQIKQSAEYQQRLRTLNPEYALHYARAELIQGHIPPADVIVDIGGAANGIPEGALLAMGYPYTPKHITIIDLPFDERLGTWITQEPPTLVTDKGTHVDYVYQSMADMSRLDDESVDMVFSGESIEHVSEEDAEKTIQEAYRILKPGGYLCMDTPNRALTRLHSPHGWIHPEHQKEYLVQELVEKVRRNGFEVVAQKSLCPMPESLKSGRFIWRELLMNSRVGERPEEGYLFFLQCEKR